MKVYLFGWGLVICAIALSMASIDSKNVEIEIYASWILYTIGLVLISGPRKHKMFENIR